MRDELAMGFAAMAGVGHSVAVFGSARTPSGSPAYALARETGRALGEAGFTIITGGGPGAMEAANRGARDAGARSIGLTIDLPTTEPPNPYLDEKLDFHYFFARKVMFVRYASAFVVLPGGFGTLDELFESLTLIQTGKIRHFPVVLIGCDFWGGLVGWLRESLLAAGTISERDLGLVTVTDSVGEAVATCREAILQQWGRS
jgi:uncharacterized protein (TIGR00730 family)